MMTKKISPTFLVFIVYGLCFACRLLEYFLLPTDQTFGGGAFAHKLAGIAILLLALKYCGWQLDDIGFAPTKILRNLFNGLAFGLLVFIPAYLVEMAILALQGRAPSLDIYVSDFGQQTVLTFFLICIAGNASNIINVIMEEGVFRGLFQKLLNVQLYFLSAAGLSAILFGIWHIAAPVRSYYDGDMSLNGMTANILLLTVASALTGFKFALLTRLTGSLYMAMGHHFIDNVLANIIHVISSTGADELLAVRISISQALSFVIVLIWYILYQRKHSISHSIMYV